MKEKVVVREDNNQGYIAVQDNELIRSAYSMELREKRLLLMAISRINAGNFPTRGQCIQITLDKDAWAEMFPSDNPWRDLKTACRGLMRRQVTMKPKEKSQLVMNWVDSVMYHEGGHVQIMFGYSVSLHLAGMLDEFTQVDLLDVAKFNSKHTIRMYELLCQMVNDNSEWWLKITIEDLRTYLGVGKSYKQFSQLNNWIIQPAIKELNGKTTWDITVEYIKKGRATNALYFRFKERDQMDLFRAEEDIGSG